MSACINGHICRYYVPIIQWFTKISLQNTALGSASLNKLGGCFNESQQSDSETQRIKSGPMD